MTGENEYRVQVAVPQFGYGTNCLTNWLASVLYSCVGTKPVLHNPFDTRVGGVVGVAPAAYVFPYGVPAGHMTPPETGHDELASPNMGKGDFFGFLNAKTRVFGSWVTTPLILAAFHVPFSMSCV